MLVLIGVTARKYITAPYPISQQDYSMLGVADTWWLHAW